MRLSPLLASPLALSAVLATAALLAGYQFPSKRVLEVGPPGDEEFLDGFHDRQRAGGRFFRWTSRESTVTFAGLEWNQDQELTLRLASGRRPPEAGPPEVLVSVNGRPVGRVMATLDSADYRIPVPRSVLSPLGDVSIALETPTFRSRAGRIVGVALEEVSLARAAVAPRPALPPLGTVGFWIVNAWVFRAFVGRAALGRRPRVRLLAHGAGTFALVVAAALARAAVARLAWEVAVALCLAYAFACQAPEWWRASRERRQAPLRFIHTLGIDDSRRRRWIEAAVLALVAGHFAAVVVSPLRWWGPKDLSIYHHVAVVSREGGDYYDVGSMRERFAAGASDRTVFAFTSPPSALPFYAPLSLVSLRSATWTWRGLNLAFLVLTGVLLCWALRLSTTAPPSPVWIALALSASEPVRITLRVGQVGLLVLLLLAWSLWGLTRRRAVVTALGIVLAAAVKVLPGFLLLHPAYRRDRRTLIAAAATGSIFLAAVLWTGGVAPWKTWLSRVLPAVSAPVAYFGNQSVAGSLRRLAGQPPDEPPAFNYTFASSPDPRPAFERLVPYGVAAAALGLVLWRMGPDPAQDLLRRQMEFATMIPLMLLLAPLVWEFYFAWLLLPFIAALAWLAARPMSPGRQMGHVALLVLAWILLQYDTTDTYRRPGWPVALMSLGLYANVVVLGCTLALLGARRGDSLVPGKVEA